MSRVSGSLPPASQKAVCCALGTRCSLIQHVENPKWKWGFAERMTEGLEDLRPLAVSRSRLATGLSVKLQLEWPCCSPVAIS